MKRIAMWSGPRNISTALLRAFENRKDTVVVDEPLYAYYLQSAGHSHPGRDEIIANCETDYAQITRRLTTDRPGNATVYYQKHMAHHVFEQDTLEWIDSLSNMLLVRDPKAMLLSLSKVLGDVSIDDTGLPQQQRLLKYLQQTGQPVAVIDSAWILQQPEHGLRSVCDYLQIPFDPAMLHWPAGPRLTDGVWAKYWYDSVNLSTGFKSPVPAPDKIPDALMSTLAECQEIYTQLLQYQLD